jgi:hypothetical protein
LGQHIWRKAVGKGAGRKDTRDFSSISGPNHYIHQINYLYHIYQFDLSRARPRVGAKLDEVGPARYFVGHLDGVAFVDNNGAQKSTQA